MIICTMQPRLFASPRGQKIQASFGAGSWAAAPDPGLVGLLTSRTDITFDNVRIRRVDAPSPAAPTWQVYDGQIGLTSGQLSLTMRDGHPLALAVREGYEDEVLGKTVCPLALAVREGSWEDDCAIEATLTTDWQGGIGEQWAVVRLGFPDI